MATLQPERLLTWACGHARVAAMAPELAVYCGTTRLRPGNFGTVTTDLASADGDFDEFLASVDESRGPLSPEQIEFKDWVRSQDFAAIAAEEFAKPPECFELAVERTLELFVRAFPLVCYFRLEVNPFYDGFYGMGPEFQLPLELDNPDPRQFITRVFGEYRKPFVRAMLDNDLDYIVQICTVAGALDDPDLMCRVLADSRNLPIASLEEEIYLTLFLREFSSSLRPNTLWSLLFSSLEGLPRSLALAQRAKHDDLQSVRAKDWAEFADALSRLPVAVNLSWPEVPYARDLESQTIAGYLVRQLRDTQSMLNQSVASDNCLYSVEENRRAEEGVGYFELVRSGRVVGTMSVDSRADGWFVEALGVSNAELPNGDEFKLQVEEILKGHRK